MSDDAQWTASLGAAIAAVRRRRHMTQADLAAAVGVRAGQVQNWERGFTFGGPDRTDSVTRISRARLHEIAAALDCRPADIVDLSEVPDPIRQSRYGLGPRPQVAVVIGHTTWGLSEHEAARVAAYIDGLIAARDV